MFKGFDFEGGDSRLLVAASNLWSIEPVVTAESFETMSEVRQNAGGRIETDRVSTIQLICLYNSHFIIYLLLVRRTGAARGKNHPWFLSLENLRYVSTVPSLALARIIIQKYLPSSERCI